MNTCCISGSIWFLDNICDNHKYFTTVDLRMFSLLDSPLGCQLPEDRSCPFLFLVAPESHTVPVSVNDLSEQT